VLLNFIKQKALVSRKESKWHVKCDLKHAGTVIVNLLAYANIHVIDNAINQLVEQVVTACCSSSFSDRKLLAKC